MKIVAGVGNIVTAVEKIPATCVLKFPIVHPSSDNLRDIPCTAQVSHEPRSSSWRQGLEQVSKKRPLAIPQGLMGDMSQLALGDQTGMLT